jgi:hypothetical protein
MSIKSATTPADLLREAKRLAAQEVAIKRDRLALAKKLIEAGHALGGEDLQVEKPIKRKRRYTRRRHSVASRPPASLRESPRTFAKKGGRKASDTSWTGTMLKILVEADRGMTYPELKAEIAKTHLGPKLLRTDKSFYGGVGKLEEKKQAFRHNGRVFAASVYERFQRDVAAGIATDEPVRNPGGGDHYSPTKAAVLAFLDENIEGARVAEILSNLEKRPELDLSDRYSKTAVYNLIARLVKREVLTKHEGIVRLPPCARHYRVASES